ncbi:hypothetical protein E2562_014581 [Oryza meyeriana var. granulata]|uniref:Uncharacterized protein n=1 Tax=Oryza meyeriana var. granulata TaxID=110450 RepID=A0A6G1DXA3_9ORYZ|nr:hypothetical protein E2562_014581 [Oryza meyeriana var. granulata]
MRLRLRYRLIARVYWKDPDFLHGRRKKQGYDAKATAWAREKGKESRTSSCSSGDKPRRLARRE